MQRLLFSTMLFLIMLNLMSCEEDVDPPAAQKPKVTIYSSGTVIADIALGQDTSIKARLFGTRVNNVPDKLTSVVVTKKDTVSNYIFDNNGRMRYAYGSINGNVENKFLKFDYFNDSTVTMSLFNYSWSLGTATFSESYTIKYVANQWQGITLRGNEIAGNELDWVKSHMKDILICGTGTVIGLFSAVAIQLPPVTIAILFFIANCWIDLLANAEETTQGSPPNNIPDPKLKEPEIIARSHGNKVIAKITFPGCSFSSSLAHSPELNTITSSQGPSGAYVVVAYDCVTVANRNVSFTCNGTTTTKQVPICR